MTVFARVRLASLAQFAALLVAVALTGAPRVVGALAPPAKHQCRCAEHDAKHQCSCATCRKAAAEAAASDATLPPCHRAAAEKALAQDSEQKGPDGQPCITGTCGALDPRPPTVSGVDPFLPPAPSSALAPGRPVPLLRATPQATDLPPEPETPPPRLA